MVSLSVGLACSGSDSASNGSTGSGGGTANGTGGMGIGTGGASTGSTGGTPGSGGANPTDGSSGGANGGIDALGDMSSGDTGSPISMRRHGKSPGCGMAAAMSPGSVTIPKCMNCSAAMGNCPRDCIAPEFAPRATGGIDFTTRPFSIKAPAGYDMNTPYPVFMGGGGCGSGAGGIDIPGDNGISIRLAIKNGGAADGGCFADGGQACSGDTTHLAYCVNSPEVPYVRAVLAWVESHYCVDLDKEFIGGSSSGAWEAYTNGCGDSDQLRGFMAIAGGKREHRWACAGPIAAFMIADTNDPMNPITTGGLEPHLDSHGSSAARDELLVRNGCTGTTGTVYDPKYPKCLKYNCPAAYPVIWCALGGGHTNTGDGGVDYAGAVWPFFMSLPPTP